MPAPTDAPDLLDEHGNPVAAPDLLDAQGSPVEAPERLNAKGEPVDSGAMDADTKGWMDYAKGVKDVALQGISGGSLLNDAMGYFAPETKSQPVTPDFPMSDANIDFDPSHPITSSANSIGSMIGAGADQFSAQAIQPGPQAVAKTFGAVAGGLLRPIGTFLTPPKLNDGSQPTIFDTPKNPDGTPYTGGVAQNLHDIWNQTSRAAQSIWKPDLAPAWEDTKRAWGIPVLAHTKNMDFFNPDGSIQPGEAALHAADMAIDFATQAAVDPLGSVSGHISPEAAAEVAARQGALADLAAGRVPKIDVPQFKTLPEAQAWANPTTIQQVGAGNVKATFSPLRLHIPFTDIGPSVSISATVPKGVATALKPFEFLQTRIGGDPRDPMQLGNRVTMGENQFAVHQLEREKMAPAVELASKLSNPDEMMKIQGALHDAMSNNPNEPMTLRVPLGDAADTAKALGFKVQDQFPEDAQRLIDATRISNPKLADQIEGARDWSVQHFRDTTLPALQKFAGLDPADKAAIMAITEITRKLPWQVRDLADQRGFSITEINKDKMLGPQQWFERQIEAARQAQGPIERPDPNSFEEFQKRGGVDAPPPEAGPPMEWTRTTRAPGFFPQPDGYAPPPESITAAAWRRQDGNIFTGTNHGEAMLNGGHDFNNPFDDSGNGFVTSTGRFVSREEAAEIQSNATGAVLGSFDEHGNFRGSMDAEDLERTKNKTVSGDIATVLQKLDAKDALTPTELAQVQEHLNSTGPQIFGEYNAVPNYRPAKLTNSARELTTRPTGEGAANPNLERGGEVDPKYGLPGVKRSASEQEAYAQRGGTGIAATKGRIGEAQSWANSKIAELKDSYLYKKLAPAGLKALDDLYNKTAPNGEVYEMNPLKALGDYDANLAKAMSNNDLEQYTAKLFTKQPVSAWNDVARHTRVVEEGEGVRPATPGDEATQFRLQSASDEPLIAPTVRDATLPELQKIWKDGGGTGDLLDQFEPAVKKAIEEWRTKISDALKGQPMSDGSMQSAKPFASDVATIDGKDYYIEEGAARSLKELKGFSKDPFALRNYLGQAAPAMLYASQLWRMSKTVLGPQFFRALVRYQLHDTWRMSIGKLMDGQTALDWARMNDPRGAGGMMAYLKNDDPAAFAGRTVNAGAMGDVPMPQMIEMAERNQVINKYGSQGEFDAVTKTTPGTSKAAQALDWFQRLSEARDTANRVAGFATRLRAGDTPAEAAIRVNEGGLFDYSKNSALTKGLAQSGAVPFANFYANAIPFVAHWAMTNPGEFMALQRTMAAVNNGQLPLSAVPAHMRDTFNMQTGVRKNDKGEVEVQLTRGSGWFPLTELSDQLNAATRMAQGDTSGGYESLKSIIGPTLSIPLNVAMQGRDDERDAAKKTGTQKAAQILEPLMPGQNLPSLLPPFMGGTLGQEDSNTKETKSPLKTYVDATLNPFHTSTVNVTKNAVLNVKNAESNRKAAEHAFTRAQADLADAVRQYKEDHGLFNQATVTLPANDPQLGKFQQNVMDAQARLTRERAAFQQAVKDRATITERFKGFTQVK